MELYMTLNHMTTHERHFLEACPEAIQLLIDYHETQATQADAMDMHDSAIWHSNRKKDLEGYISSLIIRLYAIA